MIQRIIYTLAASLILGACSQPTNLEYESTRVPANAGGEDITTWTNGTGSTSVTAPIPDETYKGKEVRFTEINLVPLNIASGVSIFGVVGTASGIPPACVTNGAQGANCTAAGGSYWTTTAGANVTGANGVLSTTIPLGYYSGSQSATMSDTNLIQGNIRTGVTIFGVTGNITPAYTNCSVQGLQGATCTLASGNYYAAAAGSNITPANGVLSTTIPQGYYSGAQTVTMSDTNLVAANIAWGFSIFGVTGTFSSGGSRIARNIAAGAITVEAETSTYAGTTPLPAGYRPVPITTDHERGDSVAVSRVGWPAFPGGACGIPGVGSTIETMIANCQTVIGAGATWTGATSGHSGQGTWKLVSRISTTMEVWRDERTKLLWSNRLSVPGTISWCKAAGAHNIGGVPYGAADPSNVCDNALYQNIAGSAESACFEGTGFTGVGGVNAYSATNLGIASTPAVSWRLPTYGDRFQANLDGLPLVFADTSGVEWLATTVSTLPSSAWTANGYGVTTGKPRDGVTGGTYFVRCVGR